jgi:hypothetical protein
VIYLKNDQFGYLACCCGEWTGVSVPTLPKPRRILLMLYEKNVRGTDNQINIDINKVPLYLNVKADHTIIWVTIPVREAIYWKYKLWNWHLISAAKANIECFKIVWYWASE